VFKDSLNEYVRYCQELKELLIQNKEGDFKRLFVQDRGKHLWGQYLNTEASILSFVSRIDAEAQHEYERAMFNNQILQVLLFLICVPTLLFTAYSTLKNIKLAELLRLAQKERHKLLNHQNAVLELRVAERMEEVMGHPCKTGNSWKPRRSLKHKTPRSNP
jgi:hypothetical protein